MTGRKITAEEFPAHFASFVAAPNANGCTLWIKPDPRRYAYIWKDGKHRLAHRIAYEMANGPIPAGMNVLHRCDVTKCVNPAHLFVGTQGDNMRDCSRKGRARTRDGDAHYSRTSPQLVPRGARNGNAKLTDEKVRSIRAEYSAGLCSQRALAAQHGVTHAVIGKVVRRKTWAHVA